MSDPVDGKNRRPKHVGLDAVIALMRAADATRRELVRTLQPFDLTLQQFNVLIILRASGADGLPTLEVAARLVEQTPGITRLMNTLAAKKYIRRKRHKDDRRQQFCFLTDSGARLIDEVMPHIRATHAQIVSDLSSSEIGQIVGLLRRVPNPT